MKLWKDGRDGRHIISTQRSLRCVLPKPSAIFGLLAYTLVVPALSSCEIFGGIDMWGEKEEKEYVDSSNFTIKLIDCCKICQESSGRVLTTDLFVYDSEGLKKLEHWWREDGLPAEINFRSSKRDKIVVAVSNSPHMFNLKTLENFSSIENLEFRRDEDDTVNPVMTGECTVSPASGATLKLRPLMGRVVVTEVSNSMKNYVRLEDPRILLTDANACVCALQEDGFNPWETIEESAKISLPCDVGMFSQYPGTEIWCYPDDGETAKSTILVLECEIKGETCRFPVNVTPIGRNATREVVFHVDSQKKYSAQVY